MNTSIEFTRINNDLNGNPRFVCHFLNIPLTEEEKKQINSAGMKFISTHYSIALEKAKKIGGKKYSNKQYGGGIVFQSYNIKKTEKDILSL